MYTQPMRYTKWCLKYKQKTLGFYLALSLQQYVVHLILVAQAPSLSPEDSVESQCQPVRMNTGPLSCAVRVLRQLPLQCTSSLN